MGICSRSLPFSRCHDVSALPLAEISRNASCSRRPSFQQCHVFRPLSKHYRNKGQHREMKKADWMNPTTRHCFTKSERGNSEPNKRVCATETSGAYQKLYIIINEYVPQVMGKSHCTQFPLKKEATFSPTNRCFSLEYVRREDTGGREWQRQLSDPETMGGLHQ